MVRIPESAIKTVIHEQAEMANTLEPNGKGGGKHAWLMRLRDPYTSRSKAGT
jgi:hypothetical protein